jgi:hypothetical protein
MTPHEGLRTEYLAPSARHPALPPNAARQVLYPVGRRIRLEA